MGRLTDWPTDCGLPTTPHPMLPLCRRDSEYDRPHHSFVIDCLSRDRYARTVNRSARRRDASGLSVELKNDLSEMPLLAEHLELFCRRRGIGVEIQSEVNLALDEIVTHIISHRDGDGRDHPIRINLAHDGASLTARVEDEGEAFDPLDWDDPTHGIHLVRTMVDEVTYSRERGQNVLVIGKRTE